MKLPGGVLLTNIELDRTSETPLYRQLYQQINQQILNGHLGSGTRLPSSRTLAKELDVSRITIINVFEQLTAEGYLESRPGDGTYVCSGWQNHSLLRPSTEQSAPRLSSAAQAALSSRSHHFSGTTDTPWAPDSPVPFVPSLPAFDAFPHNIWKRLMNKHLRSPSREMLSYGDLKGDLQLREAIAEYLYDARSIDCSPEQVIITTGAQQAINLLGTLLLNPDDSVWMEDPGYVSARLTLQSLCHQVVPLPIDKEGIDLQAGISRYPAARLVFTTPSRQHPLGITMSLNRRIELINWASRADAWIIEDDCDSEYRYTGRQMAALRGIDQNDRVIYLGTFSKVLFPSLRLGYVVLPKALIDPFCAVRANIDRSPPSLLQAVVADFIKQGHFNNHIRRMKTLYQKRQEVLVACLQQHLDGFLDVQPVDAGLHLLCWLPKTLNDEEIARGLAQRGILAYPLSHYCMNRYQPPALLLGFAGTPQEKIPAAVADMAKALEEMGLL